MSTLNRLTFTIDYNSQKTYTASLEIGGKRSCGLGSSSLEAVEKAVLNIFPRFKKAKIEYKVVRQKTECLLFNNATANVIITLAGKTARGSSIEEDIIMAFANTLISAIDNYIAQE